MTKLIITGQVRQNIRDLVSKYRLEEHVVAPGYLSREKYSTFLGSSDVFLLPMDDRPYNVGRWPNKMCDYLSFARPTISNPIGDIKTLFENYNVGLLARWEPKDFAE